MNVIEFGDSSTPPASYPPVDGWAWYIGGNTPHVWTDAEVAAIPCRYGLPIFTRSNPTGAAQALADARAALWWAANHGQPRGTLIGLDLEDAVNPAYLDAFDAALVAGGYRTVAYGQLSTITGNPRPSGGFWVGEWDGVDADPSWTGKQYESLPAFDRSAFAAAAPLWDRHPATAPTTPAGAPDTKEDEMSQTSQNGRVGLSWPAGSRHVLQAQTAGNAQLTLDVELKFASGAWYSANNGGPWTIEKGSGTWEIPTGLIAACRGAIVTVHAPAPGAPVYDVVAV